MAIFPTNARKATKTQMPQTTPRAVFIDERSFIIHIPIKV